MSWYETYRQWELEAEKNPALKAKLEAAAAEEELEDCFYTSLSFGTGGMRGRLGPGPNRMNAYTVRKAASGFGAYLLHQSGADAKEKGVVIAYDPRHESENFVVESAKVLGALGIQVHLFTGIRPTPELSFAVRELGAAGGIMLTASHNPSSDNGFKVYGEDGGQLVPAQSEQLTGFVERIEDELQIETIAPEEMKAQGLWHELGKDMDEAYMRHLLQLLPDREDAKAKRSQLKVVFTPLHGTAARLAADIFNRSGFHAVETVTEQMVEDPDFSTVTSPNPEDPAAFAYAKRQGFAQGADVLLATDPDADRVGAAVFSEKADDYVYLTGNETGALLLEAALSTQEASTGGVMLNTIVTSDLGEKIAAAYGVDTWKTLTGFKFIAAHIEALSQADDASFVFGYEESFGYLAAPFVRDKDALQALLLLSELAAEEKARGRSLLDKLEELYEQYGWHKERTLSVTREGRHGGQEIAAVMEAFRESYPEIAGGQVVTSVEDYSTGRMTELSTGTVHTLKLPVSNVLKFHLENGGWFCLRPSGTEPKLKVYCAAVGNSRTEAEQQLDDLYRDLSERIHAYVT
ncbi:alpha-phosphoglucomutase [Salsuginibacillus halophilus]|uniref:Phosphoglucomutase n=1 Tax=Salsuginibacillus halophilus TaxID=517424 RepID=A0A2P8HG51_9BACI|nr:phospho-sugar mutase [Salsuginibacillus halophilus]PSL45195.1 alpha-phosphoglucomutase [Salsuginibacillus halophilus]